MLRQAPPLEATEAFLVAARSASFRAAAQTLALSPSGFSRRIQALESFLGIALFDRSGPAIVLTAAGLRYRDQIEPAMDAIRRATSALRDSGRGRRLRLATSHSLAVGWLMPRLAGLQQRHGIEIELVITRDAQVLRMGAADLAFWGGFDADADIVGEMLIELAGVPVATKRLADGRPAPVTLGDLAEHRLLGVRAPAGIWPRWLAAAGFFGEVPPVAMVFDTNDLMYEAAACGLGVALAVPLLVERFLQDGRLRPCLAEAVPVGMGYALYHSNAEVRARPVARVFVDWLRHEIRASADRFDRWCESAAPIQSLAPLALAASEA